MMEKYHITQLCKAKIIKAVYKDKRPMWQNTEPQNLKLDIQKMAFIPVGNTELFNKWY